MTAALKNEDKSDPQKSVADSIFDTFMDDSEEEEEKQEEVKPKIELSLKIESLVLKGAHKYSKLKFPCLALDLLLYETMIMKQSNF